MKLKYSLALPMVALSLVAVGSAQADLVGTSVTGQMLIQGNPPNYFDPANGFTSGPGGLNNSQGPTVNISSSALEFGYQDSANTDKADFTGSTLTLSDTEIASQGIIGSLGLTFVFTDSAFTGLTLSKTSDNFDGGGISGSLSGNTLTLTWAGDLSSIAPSGVPGTFTAVFNLAGTPGVPDASTTVGLFGLGLFALAGLKRKFASA